jgi:hypothetical protein
MGAARSLFGGRHLVVRAQLGALVAGSPSGVPKSQSQHALLCCNEIAEKRAGSTVPSAPQKPTLVCEWREGRPFLQERRTGPDAWMAGLFYSQFVQV